MHPARAEGVAQEGYPGTLEQDKVMAAGHGERAVAAALVRVRERQILARAAQVVYTQLQELRRQVWP